MKFKDYSHPLAEDYHLADANWEYNIYCYKHEGVWIIKPFIWRKEIVDLQKIIAFSDSDFLFKLFEQAIPMLKRYAK